MRYNLGFLPSSLKFDSQCFLEVLTLTYFTFWGVRGSIPIAKSSHLHFGGNTICSEFSTDKVQIFLDAGSGFINANVSRDKPVIILFSHFHHDHIQGLLFNPDLFSRRGNVFLSTALCSKTELLETLDRYYGGRLFPEAFDKMTQNVTFLEFSEIQSVIGSETEVLSLALHHPGGCSGYRIHNSSLSVSNLLDNEYFGGQKQLLCDFVENSDLVLWDAMYTDKELKEKSGWGHSSIEQGLRFSEVADISKLALTHHCPTRTDEQLLAMEHFDEHGKCFWAKEHTSVNSLVTP